MLAASATALLPQVTRTRRKHVSIVRHLVQAAQDRWTRRECRAALAAGSHMRPVDGGRPWLVQAVQETETRILDADVAGIFEAGIRHE